MKYFSHAHPAMLSLRSLRSRLYQAPFLVETSPVVLSCAALGHLAAPWAAWPTPTTLPRLGLHTVPKAGQPQTSPIS